MSHIEKMMEEMVDYEIDMVNRYINGEHVHPKRGRFERDDVTACMTMAIERACGIHQKGIEVGSFHFARYKREKKRVERYWADVRAGKRTDTRRGFDTERKGKI
jgi:hypothetical protein